MPAECLVCGSPKLFFGGRCDGCYRFRLRRGRDRTFDELRPLLERRLEKEQVANLIRGILGHA
jgi:hypothetical protein